MKKSKKIDLFLNKKVISNLQKDVVKGGFWPSYGSSCKGKHGDCVSVDYCN